MSIARLFLAGLMAAAVLMPSTLVQAQEGEGGGEQAQAAERDPQENWLKICEPLESGERACIMRQVVLQNNQFKGSFVLRNDPGQESRLMAVAAVPLGVLLPFQMTWQIDGAQPVRVPFMTCDPRSCVAQLVINEAYVNSLKRGATLTLTAKNRQNQDFTVDINLSGFTATYEAETAMTFEEFQQESSGENALEQVLQDRAEQLRRQMGSDGSAEGDAAEGDAEDAGGN